MEAEILKVGNEVRDLKLNKADKDVIKAKVDELLNLKAKLEGKEPAKAAPAKAAPAKAAAPSPAPAPAPKKVEVNAFIEGRFPKYTSPKPQPLSGGTNLTTNLKAMPSDEEIFINDISLNLDALDARLSYFSFISGFQPGKSDSKAINILLNSNTPSASGHNNINRWFKHCNSYSLEERNKW